MPSPLVDLTDLGPLYHDYAFFGAVNEQLPGIFAANQRAKAPILTAYIALAIAEAREHSDDVSFAELFCADAYYAMVAARLGARTVVGVDNNRDAFSGTATEVARRLGIEGFRLLERDVAELGGLDPVDVVANVGGLYHVANPEEVLRASYDLARRYLVVQSVVSLATDDPEYFEAPAPGWDWGSRYSLVSFDTMIRSQGWNVLAWHANELTGNDDPKDRGSVYYLVEK
jgi:Methyltransferase domain